MLPRAKNNIVQNESNELSHDEFARIAAVVREESGIFLSQGKERLVFGRLNKRLRVLGLKSFSQYCTLLDAEGSEAERKMLVNCITTNVTGFYRERHHFDFLKGQMPPHILGKFSRNEPVRLWSAGCSNGAEPYTIALTLLSIDPLIKRKDVRILATDIDTEILKSARQGVYDAEAIKDVPKVSRDMYFSKSSGSVEQYEISADVRSLIRFNPLNLHSQWPFHGNFDVIFCRNVMIYFEPQDQQKLWNRMIDRLTIGGLLFIGHSERLTGSTEMRVVHRGPTIYQKRGRD